MKKKIFTMACLLVAWVAAFGQCEIPTFRDTYDPGTPMRVYCLVHVVRSSSGVGPTLAQANAMMQKASNDFLGITADTYIANNCPGANCIVTPQYTGANVCNPPAVAYPSSWSTPGVFNTNIHLCWDVVFHDDDALVMADPDNNLTLSSFAAPPVSVVNVWVNEFVRGPFFGSYFVPTFVVNNGVKVGYASCNGNPGMRDLSHELGHYFGLGHVFDASCAEVGLGACASELVNDLCADTDPDPNMAGWFPSYCNLAALTPADKVAVCPTGGPSPGPYNATFTTRVNIMQYGNEGCNVLFSPMQGRRMRCHLDNHRPGLHLFADGLVTAASGCPDPCVADFEVNNVNTCPLTPVTFTDMSGNGIVSWLWDFGDGNQLSQTTYTPTVTHAYAAPGTYTVSLTVQCSDGGTDTQVRTALVTVVGSAIPLPYFQNFDARVFPHAGWETWFNVPPVSFTVDHNWSRIEGGVFTGAANCGNPSITTNYPWHKCTPDLLGQPATFAVSAMSPTGYTTNTTLGVPNACVGTTYGATGAISQLTTPIFDLSSVQNPVLRFHYSHQPSGGSTLGPCACDFNYPGMPAVGGTGSFYDNTCYWGGPNVGCDCNNPGSPACSSAVMGPNCPDNPILNVYVSDDCGSNWSLLWSASGTALNTVSGPACTSYGYFPLTTGVWQQHQENLCNLLGSAFVRFRFEVVQQRYMGNIFIDDFYVGPDPAVTSPLVISPSVGNSCSNLQCTGSVTASVGGSTPPVTFTLTGTGTLLSNGTGLFTSLCPGSYILSASDAGGLCSQVPVTIGVTPSLTASHSHTDANCQASDGTVTLSVLPGSPPYTFLLCTMPNTTSCVSSGPVTATSHIFNSLPAGTYHYLVSDQAGDCASGSVTVGSTTNLTPTASAVYNCVTGTGTISFTSPLAGAGYNFEVTSQSPLPPFTLTGTSGTFTSVLLLPGTYTISADDGAGNCGSAAVTLASPAPLSLSYNFPGCGQTNGSATVSISGGSGPFNYVVTHQNGSSNPVVASGTTSTGTFNVSGLVPGNYLVSVDDGTSNCGSGSFAISGATLNMVVTPIDPNCSGCNGSIEVSGSIPLPWMPATVTLTPLAPVGAPVTLPWAGSPLTFFNLCPGTYEISVSSTAGYCFEGTYALSAPSVATLSHTVSTLDAYWCIPNGEVSLYPVGTSPYAASLMIPGGSVVASTSGVTSTPITFNGLPPGTYDYFVQDQIGCAFGTVTVGQSGVPVAQAGADQSTCLGNAILLSGTSSSPGLIEEWYDPNGGLIGTNPISFVPTVAGTYQFQVRDLSGTCVQTDEMEVEILNCCQPGASFLYLPVQGVQPLASSLGTVPPGSVIYVHEDLQVDVNTTWSNCQVYMNTDARIRIQPGVSLTASGCQISSCDQMWRGISNAGSTAQLTLTGCEVRDAHSAIDLLNGWVGLTLTSNVFDQNRIHASFESMDPASTYQIEGNQFLGNAITLSPWSGTVPWTGIEVLGSENVIIGNAASGTSGINLFDHLAQGIRVSQGHVVAQNNKFDWIQEIPGLPLSGVSVLLEQPSANNLTSMIGGGTPGQANEFFLGHKGVVANSLAAVDVVANNFVKAGIIAVTFDNLGSQVAVAQKNFISGWNQGVKATGLSGTNWSILSNNMTLSSYVPQPQFGVSLDACIAANLGEVRSNQIRLTGNGITLQNCQDVEVAGNIVNASANATPAIDLHGIWVNGGFGIDLFQNELNAQGAGSSAVEYGIRIVNSPGGQVFCNLTKSWERGIAFEGACNPTTVQYNTLQTCNYGIVLQHCGEIGPQVGPGDGPLNKFVGGGWTLKLASLASNGALSSTYYYPSAGAGQFNPLPTGVIGGGTCTTATPWAASPSAFSTGNFNCTVMPAKTSGNAIEETGEGMSLGAFPNPTRAYATVVFRQMGQKPAQLRVVNAQGLVLMEKALGANPESILDLDFAQFTSGVYTLVVNCGSQVLTCKLVVQH